MFGKIGTFQKFDLAASYFIGIGPLTEHDNTLILLSSEHCRDGFFAADGPIAC